jgi:hypothetical protein
VLFVAFWKLLIEAWSPASVLLASVATKHSLRDGPAVISPPVAAGVEGAAVVVVVVGGTVVVVVGGAVVVVAPPPPPPAPTPPAPLAPPDAVGVVIGVGAAGTITALLVVQRFTRPENWLLVDSEARVRTTSERTEFESRPPNADADASMPTNATRTQEEIASVRILGIRFVVFARKKFLNELLYMKNKFAFSGHITGTAVSIVAQFSLTLTK